MYESSQSRIPSIMMLPCTSAALMGRAPLACNPLALCTRKKKRGGKKKTQNKTTKKVDYYAVCFVLRVNGKLVALKVIRLQEEEGTPFTAIREGKETAKVLQSFRLGKLVSLFDAKMESHSHTQTHTHAPVQTFSCMRIGETL